MLPSPTPRLHDHVSIWSVAARDAKTFFRIVGALWLAAIGFIVYEKRDESPWSLGAAGTTEQAWRGIGDFTFAVLADFGTVGIAITIVAMLLTRAVNKTGELLMSLYQVVVNRFVIPVIEAHKAEGREQGRTEGREQGRTEGREQGRTEGRDQGRAEARAEWQAWNECRLAAERAGARVRRAASRRLSSPYWAPSTGGA